MESGSGEAPPKKYSQGLDVKEFKTKQGLEKPRQSFFSKARNIILGIGITAGTGAAVEATAHPIEDTTNAAVQAAGDVIRGGEKLVDNYNEDPAIRQKSEEIAGKLNGTIPLSKEEQIFEKVKIVPAGATFEERQKMEQDGTPVNVRNYPGTNTPDGRFSSIIGELPQGTVIEHVISIKGGVPHPATANDTGDWWSFVYREPDADPNQPGKIGFVYGMYGTALAVGEAASSTPTPSEAPTNQ